MCCLSFQPERSSFADNMHATNNSYTFWHKETCIAPYLHSTGAFSVILAIIMQKPILLLCQENLLLLSRDDTKPPVYASVLEVNIPLVRSITFFPSFDFSQMV